MPSIAPYTPYETLKLCQSIAQYGADTASFEDIASTLNANELIREGNTYDATRLTADALHGLYDDLLRQEKEAKSPLINGDALVEAANPRKRKLSVSPAPSGEIEKSEEDILHSLVDKLYARFREEAIKDIKRDEEDYASIQNEVQELEKQTQSEQAPNAEELTAPTTNPLVHKRQGSRTDISSLLTSEDDNQTPRPVQDERKREQNGSLSSLPQQAPPALPHSPAVPSQHSPVPGAPSPRPLADLSQQQQQQHTPTLQHHHSPGAFHRQLPPPSPHRPQLNAAPAPHHGFGQGPQGHPVPILPPPGMAHMPPPMEPPTQKRGSSASTPARNSPVLQHHQYPQPYPGYPHYQQPPPHWQHGYPPQPYPQHMPYPPQGYYPPQGNRHGPLYQTPPPQGHFQHYPNTAPVPYPTHPPQNWQPSPHPPYLQTQSATTTPIPPSQRRPIQPRSGSSTPWKRRQLPPGTLRPPSPARPEREVSPLTDTEPDDQPPRRAPSQVRGDNGKKLPRTSRRGRPPSITPSASNVAQSRSQSIASHKSETPSERPRRGAQKIKTEAPSTPMPVSSEAEQSGRSTGRRGRPRTATVTSASKIELARTGVTKRKHESIDRRSPSPVLPSPSLKNQAQPYQHDPSLVLVSKNFTKTSQLVLNEITSHKLAGIFAKPLSERDAPGYKNLVLRPQDLKNIRAAVTKGSRAAVAAIEALEEKQVKGEEGEGEVGNAMYLVKKTDELVPPKGIVNAGQLETELVRMFANAVMFNPLPTSERGFGRSLRLRRNSGDVGVNIGTEEEREGSESGSSDGGDEGIIRDARDMFEDVMGMVRGWRSVEGERMEGGSRGSLSEGGMLRGSSVEETVEEGEGDGGTRKRRRIGD